MADMAQEPVDLFSMAPRAIDQGHLQALVDGRVSEGFRIEYKRELGDGGTVLNGICAMANTFGGIVLVGVDEDREKGRAAFGVPGPDGLVGVSPAERARPRRVLLQSSRASVRPRGRGRPT